jgi:hypothetical protein
MKFGFIAKHRSVWPVAWLCEALGVSRSGFHAWLKRGPCARSREDDVIMPAVKASFVASARTYGARRIWRDVLEAGFSCGLHKIERLMRAQALRARPRRRALPQDDGERSASAIAPNGLDRQFTAERPNRKWVLAVARSLGWKVHMRRRQRLAAGDAHHAEVYLSQAAGPSIWLCRIGFAAGRTTLSAMITCKLIAALMADASLRPAAYGRRGPKQAYMRWRRP